MPWQEMSPVESSDGLDERVGRVAVDDDRAERRSTASVARRATSGWTAMRRRASRGLLDRSRRPHRSPQATDRRRS